MFGCSCYFRHELLRLGPTKALAFVRVERGDGGAIALDFEEIEPFCKFFFFCVEVSRGT